MGRADSRWIKDLVALAEGQGWTVDRTRTNHLRFWPVDKSISPVVCSTAVNARRANIEGELRRAGLVFPDNAGRVPEPTQRERRLNESSEKLRTAVLNSIEHLAPSDADLSVIDSLTPDGLVLLSLLIGDDGRITLTCKCGVTLHRLQGYMTHLAKCTEGGSELLKQYRQLEEPDVKRDMHKPPQRERAQCPDCPEWFWVNQQHLLQQHMAAEHGKQQCPYCFEWHTLRNGSLTKHINDCDQKPEGMPPAPVATVLPFDGTKRGKRRPDPIVASTPRPERFPAKEPDVVDDPPGVVDVPSTPAPTEGSDNSRLQPFIWRRVGHKVTVTTYHLYKDCGMVASDTPGHLDYPGHPLDGHEVQAIVHVDVDDTMIDLLALRCCRACERRSKQVTVEQMVTDWFATMNEECPRDELALQFLVDLADYGYVIKKGKA